MDITPQGTAGKHSVQISVHKTCWMIEAGANAARRANRCRHARLTPFHPLLMVGARFKRLDRLRSRFTPKCRDRLRHRHLHPRRLPAGIIHEKAQGGRRRRPLCAVVHERGETVAAGIVGIFTSAAPVRHFDIAFGIRTAPPRLPRRPGSVTNRAAAFRGNFEIAHHSCCAQPATRAPNRARPPTRPSPATRLQLLICGREY